MASPLTGQLRLDYIQTVWHAMPWEQRRDPHYRMSSPYWDAMVEDEYNARFHSFFPTSTSIKPPN